MYVYKFISGYYLPCSKTIIVVIWLDYQLKSRELKQRNSCLLCTPPAERVNRSSRLATVSHKLTISVISLKYILSLCTPIHIRNLKTQRRKIDSQTINPTSIDTMSIDNRPLSCIQNM